MDLFHFLSICPFESLASLCGYLVSIVRLRAREKKFWIKLNDLGNLINGAWCVGRYFNEVLNRGDRNRLAGSTVQMSNFHSWVS